MQFEDNNFRFIVSCSGGPRGWRNGRWRRSRTINHISWFALWIRILSRNCFEKCIWFFADQVTNLEGQLIGLLTLSSDRRRNRNHLNRNQKNSKGGSCAKGSFLYKKKRFSFLHLKRDSNKIAENSFQIESNANILLLLFISLIGSSATVASPPAKIFSGVPRSLS